MADVFAQRLEGYIHAFKR